MKKKFIILFCILFFALESFALDNRYPLEMQRAKKLDQIIKRVNNIYSFINLYVLQTGSLPSSTAILSSKYANINTDGFLDTDSIAFTVNSSNYTVTFTNLIPSGSSELVKGLYKVHPDLDANATVNSANLSLTIGLKPETIKFLTYKSRIEALDSSALISESTPVCNASTNTGKLWYQPDANGGFNISFCEPGWQILSNKINISIYRSSVTALLSISPPSGTIGYALNTAVTPNEVNEYVYDGITWRKVEN